MSPLPPVSYLEYLPKPLIPRRLNEKQRVAYNFNPPPPPKVYLPKGVNASKNAIGKGIPRKRKSKK